MEIRARYISIGLFTLAVIGAGFAFVYWLNTTAGLGQRTVYRIRYDSPVSGLLKGSAVLFNGIRVGEVTTLNLDPAAPAHVTIDIAIERRAPVRPDTKIGIEFQGLAGAPVVTLTGGTPSLPVLTSVKGVPPILVAEKNAGQGVTQAARDVLRHIDAVVTDNADPLRNLITNLDKFSTALGRNSDRVDSIVAGLERLTGGGTKTPPRIFELAAPTAFPGLQRRPTAQLHVLEPTALSEFDTEKILVRRTENGELPQPADAHWPDMLPKVVQARIVQSFENAQYMQALGRVPEGTRSDFQLLIDIRSFHVNAGAAVVAEIELAAKIISAEGRMVDARLFRASVPAATLNAEVAAKALNDAFAKVAVEIVTWTCAAI
jgi:phospholipid/cholesterol/gamma-HCH transport system substrate-binding protein